ncbi:uclacyanin-2-like [Juglans microcarpa x Juglans regia]|uniref:uclacyanin-2-like n=1 Tax=Juglans microcarpa x Juglans regia TaxID=2249226 RepID=UPI001B7E30FF|nr:uclacyanin-2-like [Juglans microcarpa x Juglans regia]
MAKRLDIVFLAVIAVAALLQSSVAQTSHTVGDALGWAIPPNGASDYSNWAAGKTFAVGDILVFTYTAGHDVARVTKAAFDACNGTSPISLKTDGPVNETLNEAGEHYYICTVSTHCSLGQKLAINVSAATSPAPQPSTPPPATTPTAPTPSAAAPQPSSPSPSPSSATPPTSAVPAPSRTATPPSPTASPPSPTASTPSPTASPPSPTTSPPSPPATPPSSSATPPTSPSTPSPTDDAFPPPPPPPNSATSLGLGGSLSAGFLSIVVAFLY